MDDVLDNFGDLAARGWISSWNSVQNNDVVCGMRLLFRNRVYTLVAVLLVLTVVYVVFHEDVNP